MVLTVSLIVSLSLAQKVEVIRGGTKKAKKPAATAPAENPANAAKEKELAEKQKALDAREQDLGAKEKALEAKEKDLQAKDEESKEAEKKKKKAQNEQLEALERQAAQNGAAIGDLNRALGGQ